jgi:coproporphyrinogen III oxidase-like Fe-S oxidoreductase
LYIHIPYCRQRCRYCDFAIVPIGNHGTADSIRGFEQMNERYVQTLLTELKQIQPLQKIPLQSIYFGGGTPSLAPVESIAQILHHVHGTDRSPFILDEHVEITMEMDPGTFDRTQLQALRNMRVNRISLGVQSLDDVILEGMGRCHRRHDIAKAIQDIYQVYGDEGNYSIDLISGVPGLTLAKWVDTLQQVTSREGLFAPLRPKHISIYDLQLEAGTVFEKLYANPKEGMGTRLSTNDSLLRLPSEEECAFMYKYAAGYLRTKSFEHYEVSSYAYAPHRYRSQDHTYTDSSRISWRSRHNQLYWDYASSWYALGLGATSFVNRNLVSRPRAMYDYLQWVEGSIIGSSLEQTTTDMVSEDDNFLQDILLKRLRTSDGLDLEWLESTYGIKVVEKVLMGAQLGLDLGLAEKSDSNSLRLRDPDGYALFRIVFFPIGGLLFYPFLLSFFNAFRFLYSNFIISSIFAELELVDTSN